MVLGGLLIIFVGDYVEDDDDYIDKIDIIIEMALLQCVWSLVVYWYLIMSLHEIESELHFQIWIQGQRDTYSVTHYTDINFRQVHLLNLRFILHC